MALSVLYIFFCSSYFINKSSIRPVVTGIDLISFDSIAVAIESSPWLSAFNRIAICIWPGIGISSI